MPKKTKPIPKPEKIKAELILSEIKNKVAKKKTDTTELSITTTEEKPFRSTPAMRLWVATAAELATDNISKIAEECKISRPTWYEWLAKPGFLEWYNEERERLMVLVRTKLDNIGLQMAKKDYRYWEAMQKIAGRKLSEDSQSSSPVGTPIQQFNFNSNKYIKER